MRGAFHQNVLMVVRRTPKGRVITYREVAKRAGSPRAFRAVGNILSRNFDPAIPCHRVIRSDGAIGGYNRRVRRKRELLRQENAIVPAENPRFLPCKRQPSFVLCTQQWDRKDEIL